MIIDGDLTTTAMIFFALTSLFGGIAFGAVAGGLMAAATAMVETGSSGCHGAGVGFLCHGAAGLVGLVAAVVVGSIYESCKEDCGGYLMAALGVILVVVHIVARVVTIVFVQRINRIIP